MNTYYCYISFLDEKIEGSSFLLLNEKDLNDMKIKKGPAKKILKFLEDCSQASLQVMLYLIY